MKNFYIQFIDSSKANSDARSNWFTKIEANNNLMSYAVSLARQNKSDPQFIIINIYETKEMWEKAYHEWRQGIDWSKLC